MGVEQGNYWNSSDISMSLWLQKLSAKLAKGIVNLLAGEGAVDYAEEKFVYDYLDPEMYYAGKYVASMMNYANSSSNKNIMDSIVEYLGEHASELYRDTVIAGLAGMSGSAPSLGVAGSAGAGAGAVVEGAGALVVGKGIAVGVAGGATIYLTNEYNLNKSQSQADKNKEQMDKAKGESKTVDDLINESEPGRTTKGKSTQYEKLGDFNQAEKILIL